MILNKKKVPLMLLNSLEYCIIRYDEEFNYICNSF